MPTKQDFLKLADDCAAERSRLLTKADELAEAEATLRALAAKAGDGVIPGTADMGQLFHTRSQKSSRVDTPDMNAQAKINMSKRRSTDPFTKAVRAKRLTQNDLAKRLDIPVSLLSMYRTGKRKIPQDRADTIESLIGWKADAKHWPGGIVSAD